MQEPIPFREFYGIAAETLDSKNNPSGKLKFICPEMNPFHSGEVEHVEKEISFSTEDVWGTRQSSTATAKNTIEAFFVGSNSSISMPDLHLGEQVMILQYGKQDLFYWRPFLNDEKLRLREHYRIYCMSSPTRIKNVTNDNTYFIEINTKQGEKGITISTSKSDGEAYVYLAKIDCEKHTVEIKDDIGNIIKMESDKPRIFIKNSAGCKVDLDKENIFIIATNNIIMKAKNLISTKSQTLSIDHATGMLKVLLAAIKNCGRSTSC